jgi:hypothetical protein
LLVKGFNSSSSSKTIILEFALERTRKDKHKRADDLVTPSRLVSFSFQSLPRWIRQKEMEAVSCILHKGTPWVLQVVNSSEEHVLFIVSSRCRLCEP